MTCKGQTGTGEYTANKTVANVTLTFTGCEEASQKCTTASHTAGEVAWKTLEGGLGIITTSKEGPAKNKIGLALVPVGGGSVAEFACVRPRSKYAAR